MWRPDPILKTIGEVETINQKLREENARLKREADDQFLRQQEVIGRVCRERDEVRAEVKRKDDLILDADTITHWYLARCSGPVPQEAIRVQVEARRIRAALAAAKGE